MATVLTVGGVTVSVPSAVILRKLVAHCRGGVPTLTFAVRGGALPGLPDPYLGKEARVTVSGTLSFVGDCLQLSEPEYTQVGWVRTYQCYGLRNRGDYIPHTDNNTLTDQSAYNLAADNQSSEYIAARAGRTIGQILTDVFTMPDNAAALSAAGIGAYTSLTPPTLPAATLADFALLTLIPPVPVYFGGEKLLGAYEAFVAQWAPNHLPYVAPDGTIRCIDQRTYSPHTFTFETDLIRTSGLSRDISNCYSRVVVRGTAIAEMFNFSTRNGGLSEAPFAHDGLTVAQAKAAWVPSDWKSTMVLGSSPGPNGDQGTCTCPSTTTVTVTSDLATTKWPSNFWDQTSTGRLGTVLLSYSAGTNIQTYAQRQVVSNTALLPGGTSVLTVTPALPHLLYDHYVLVGLAKNASNVWTLYQLPAWAALKVAKQSTYPFAYHNSTGGAATLSSTALGSVLWSIDNSGNPPYNEVTVGVQVDAITGLVRFSYPTFLTAGSKVPDDVRAIVPINVGANTATQPPDSGGLPVYAGTSNTVDGLQRTLTVTVRNWRDPGNHAAMLAYASDVLDSVKDAVTEGTVVFLGLHAPALVPGMSINVAGSAYATGWEAVNLPNVETQLEWSVDGLNHVTTMRGSSRRSHFSAEAFLKPDRTGITFGGADTGLNMAGMGMAVPNFAAMLPSALSMMPGVPELPSIPQLPSVPMPSVPNLPSGAGAVGAVDNSAFQAALDRLLRGENG